MTEFSAAEKVMKALNSKAQMTAIQNSRIIT